MTLAEQLTKIRDGAASRIPEAAQTIMHRATEDLRASGILDRVIRVGDRLPDFTLLNQTGTPISSLTLRNAGPLVLTVFRGSW
ncbi:MAG: hypothetical protein AAGG11_04250 [Pseudomonadota bacterium]